VLCPYINDNNKEWCKEFAEKNGENGVGRGDVWTKKLKSHANY